MEKSKFGGDLGYNEGRLRGGFGAEVAEALSQR